MILVYNFAGQFAEYYVSPDIIYGIYERAYKLNKLLKFLAIFKFSNRALTNLLASISLLISIAFYINYINGMSFAGFDDAYMFIRYADNFLDGQGIAWNRDGMQTYGATSLLYLFVVILFRWAFPATDVSIVLIIASAFMGLLAIAVMAKASTQFSKSKVLSNAHIPVAAMMMILFLLSPIYKFHLVGGMDTTLSLLINSCLLLAALYWIYYDNLYSLLSTIFLGYLSFLSRPDNLIYSLFLPISLVAILSKDQRIKKLIYYLCGLVILLGVDTFIKFVIFGDPLPLPFYAKTSGYYEGYSGAYKWNPLMYLFDFGSLVLPFLISIALFVQKKSIKFFLAFMIPIAITFAYYFSALQIMGLEARYYFPALPFFIVCSFLIFDYFLETHNGNELTGLLAGRYIRIRLLAILMMIILLPQPAIKVIAGRIYERLFLAHPEIYSSTTNYITVSRRLPPELGWWQSIQTITKIAVALPEGTKFALSEYGFIGANAPDIYIIDPLGLNDPVFAHQGFSASEFFDRKPDLIWFPHSDYTKIVASILNSEEFWTEYEFYPGAFDYGIAIRKDARNYRVIYDAVEKSWQESYLNLEIDEYAAQLVSMK